MFSHNSGAYCPPQNLQGALQANWVSGMVAVNRLRMSIMPCLMPHKLPGSTVGHLRNSWAFCLNIATLALQCKYTNISNQCLVM